jgi:hypothetical protein
LIAAGPRSPQPGAPYTYVTTDGFLSRFGFSSLRDLPDFEKLEDAGLLSKERLLREPDVIESLMARTRSSNPCHTHRAKCGMYGSSHIYPRAVILSHLKGDC